MRTLSSVALFFYRRRDKNEKKMEFFLSYEESNLAQDMARDLKRIDAIREHNTDVLDAALRKQTEVIKNSAFADENNLSEEYVSILRRARTYVLDSSIITILTVNMSATI